jgi:hypothetical protein
LQGAYGDNCAMPQGEQYAVSSQVITHSKARSLPRQVTRVLERVGRPSCVPAPVTRIWPPRPWRPPKSRWPRRGALCLRGWQNPHCAADTRDHAEHEDNHPGNQPRRERWYGNPVGLVHGTPRSPPPVIPCGPKTTLCSKRETVNYINALRACARGIAGSTRFRPPSGARSSLKWYTHDRQPGRR